MNYLAHAYLSFGDPEIVTGNLISDFVKGKKKFEYPRRILAGIDLHREIDTFTDMHPVNKGAARVFKPAYGLYAAAFVDIAFDHFLAVDLAQRDENAFREFTVDVYRQLQHYESILPPAFRSLFPYMRQHDWLFNYQFSWGIENSFRGLVHRARYLTESGPAVKCFEENYDLLRDTYREFFPELLDFSLKKFSDIH